MLTPTTPILLHKNTALHFASINQGQKLITQPDTYIKGMGTFDHAFRLEQPHDGSVKELLAMYARSVCAWTGPEKFKLYQAARHFYEVTAPYNLPFPKNLFLVKTSGHDEGGAYTRGQSIFLPQNYVAFPQAELDWLLAHEAFHILSRHNPTLRDRLYKIIGFHLCNRIKLPPFLQERKISDPDSPHDEHYISITVRGEEAKAIPVRYALAKTYDPEKTTTFRDDLLLLEGDEQGTLHPKLANGAPLLTNPAYVDGYYEQIGRNTTYTRHPEEIMAENFTYALDKAYHKGSHCSTKTLKSPQILDEIRKTLLKGKACLDAPTDFDRPRPVSGTGRRQFTL